MGEGASAGAELSRLVEDERRLCDWKRWGPYLAERQWGTVREDYSARGDCWEYFPHEQARSRAYRWGEDGLLGLTDRQCRLCFAVALWNGRDSILKERLFGLTGPEGNHGEDVKECYFYLDATPTASYLRALYKYPQGEFPYARLVEESRRRDRRAGEFELQDTGVFDGNRYFDVVAEYAKASPDDVLIRITAVNRGPEAATLHLLPTLWFRNTWSWGRTGEGYWPKPLLEKEGPGRLRAEHASLGPFVFAWEGRAGAPPAEPLFTENETNYRRLFGVEGPLPHVKDAFHDYVIGGRSKAVSPEGRGTKAALHERFELAPGAQAQLRLRLTSRPQGGADPFSSEFETTFARRIQEADEFHESRLRGAARYSVEEKRVVRQAWAGLVWNKQFYHYVVKDWLEGDPASAPPPPERKGGRNRDWNLFYARDVLSMPDKWEYPWFAAWDLAFHMVSFAEIDPTFAKDQLVLLLREWYMHPSGQLPAYEFAFSDVNPPVHAWACWRVYELSAKSGKRDRLFLARTFQKLVLCFTWWVNRKDALGNNLFSGGFLGLDNVGVFDRSRPLPGGGSLEQADGTAWMAFFCVTMLEMALELARDDPAYADMASKFFEHFVAIADAMNRFGGSGLWDEADGFYYDRLEAGGAATPLRIRSLVGLIPLLAVGVLDDRLIASLPGFQKRLQWFVENRPDLAGPISCLMTPAAHPGAPAHAHRLLAIPSRERLQRVLAYALDERELLSPHGIRSLSRWHRDHPYVFPLDGGGEARVDYEPAESTSGLFGGNSNWRGPVWFPVNYLLIEALERYHHFYGDSLRVECPTGSGRLMNLKEISQELAARLSNLFLPDERGRRACHGDDPRFASDPAWKELLLFHEYFDGDTGRGLGASHQTGWTALVARCLAKARAGP
ncbi:MAG: MGH1-like glycoside hydrolase domain-containing protein [Myxococcales bacterium]